MAIYYIADIAAGGSDSNAGTTGAPFLTLVKAWRACANGDTIRIKTPGTWDGQIAKFHTRALAGTGTGGGADPVSGNSNANPTGVTIEIDPATTTGTATFKIPVGTGWGKWRTEGQNNIALKYGYLWHWEATVASLTLTINGLDADGLTPRIILQDYADNTHRYDFYGSEGEYSAAFALRRNGSTSEFCWVQGVQIKQYGAQGFHNEGTQGSHFYRCSTSNGQDGQVSFPSDHDDRTANVLANGVGLSRGCVTNFRLENCDGTRVVTTLSASAARGATTITLTTVTGIAVGHPIVIFGATDATLDPLGLEKTEVRRVMGIAGNVVTLGGFKHAMSSTVLGTKPLRFAHASGLRVATQFGVEECSALYAGRACRNTNVSTAWTTNVANDDTGGQGVSIKGSVTNALIYHTEIAYNWTVEGSYDYNVDGSGGAETYNMGELTRNVMNMCKVHDSHSANETGVNTSSNANGGMLISENVFYGDMDFQNKGRANNAATAGLALLRAARHWVFRSNTAYYWRGSSSSMFLHDFGSSYSGPANSLDNVKVMENIIFTRNYSTQIYRHASTISSAVGAGVKPPGQRAERNIFWRGTSTAGNGAYNAFTSPQTFAFTEAGRAAYQTATGLAVLDKWNTDPGMADPNNANFTLLPSSAARGMGESGDDVGAIPYEAADVSVTAITATGTGTAPSPKLLLGVAAAVAASTGAAITSGRSVNAPISTIALTGTAIGVDAGIRTAVSETPLGYAGTGPIVASDDFGRAAGSGLGTSSSGHLWTTDVITPGAGGEFRINALGQGEAFIAQAAQQHGAALLGVSARDVRARVRWQIDKLPVTDLIEMWLWVRTTGVFDSGYASHMILFPTTINGNFNRRTTGNNRTAILTSTALPGAPPLAIGVWWVMLFECIGANPTLLRMKIYREQDGEPSNWNFETTDSAGPQVAGSPGIAFRMDTGTTNPPFVYAFDDLSYQQLNVEAAVVVTGSGASAPAAVASGTGSAYNAAPAASAPSTGPSLTITMGMP